MNINPVVVIRGGTKRGAYHDGDGQGLRNYAALATEAAGMLLQF